MRLPNKHLVLLIIIPLMAIMFYRFFSKKVEAVKQIGKPVLLVASTDMTHYESQEQAQSKDRLAIDKIIALDPQGLLEIVRGQ